MNLSVMPRLPFPLPEYFGIDKEFILKAVKYCPCVLQFISNDLKTDREFILDIVKQNGHALKYVREEFQRDEDVVMAAVEQDNGAFRHASDYPKGNEEFMLCALKMNLELLRYVSENHFNYSFFAKTSKTKGLGTHASFRNYTKIIPSGP